MVTGQGRGTEDPEGAERMVMLCCGVIHLAVHQTGSGGQQPTDAVTEIFRPDYDLVTAYSTIKVGTACCFKPMTEFLPQSIGSVMRLVVL